MRHVFLLGVAIAFAALPPQGALAHGDEEEGTELEGYEVSVAPAEAIRGDEAPLEARISAGGAPLTGAVVTLTVDRHEAGVSDRLAAAERESGSYAATYRFTEAGEYEVHVEFADFGETKRVTRSVVVLQESWFTPGRLFGVATFGLAALALAAGLIRRRWKAGVGAALAILVAGGLAYSLYVTLGSGAASRGVVTCVAEDECYLTAHIHAYVYTEVCGERTSFPIEKGSLSGPHTHEERNIIHWHDRLPYDRAAGRPLETTPFTLGAFLGAMGASLDRSGSCPDGNAATLKMFVNGKPSDALEGYVWSDRDVIVLIFDGRTVSEVTEWLRENPIKFPALGRG